MGNCEWLSYFPRLLQWEGDGFRIFPVLQTQQDIETHAYEYVDLRQGLKQTLEATHPTFLFPRDLTNFFFFQGTNCLFVNQRKGAPLFTPLRYLGMAFSSDSEAQLVPGFSIVI